MDCSFVASEEENESLCTERSINKMLYTILFMVALNCAKNKSLK